ncbi:MAG: 3'-5' exonuclease [Bacteroidales bacterium]|nr:3'-5' exonuclease [Bacteroidales bacterium]
MEIKLKRPLVFFDIESTGLNVSKDRIVEISFVKLYPPDNEHPEGRQEIKTRRINPGMPIPPEATAIHHITDEDVRECPTFKQIAKSLAQQMEGCDIAGYNSINFDIPLLAQEFSRCGVEFDFSRHKIVDVQNIFFRMEPRNLSAAYKFYCNKDLEGAHSAQADTLATLEVLKAQLDKYSDTLQNDVDTLAEFSSVKKTRLDLAGAFVLNDNGKTVFGFGKYKGELVADIFEKKPGYYDWIQKGDFTDDTKKVALEIYLNKDKYR